MANEAQPAAPGKMWSGRFREPLDGEFESWQRSFSFDWRLLAHEIAASKAHARTIEQAGVLSAEESIAIQDALDGIRPKLRRLGLQVIDIHEPGRIYAGEHTRILDGGNSLPYLSQAEDVHHFVELELTQAIGSLALKLHTGRSRNEQVATGLRLYVRDAIDRTRNDLAAWAGAMLTAADTAGDAVMPGYTHLQRAEPVLVAHWLLAYVEMILRDCSRLQDARARLNVCPLGSGAIAGATLKLDRGIAARELGFDGPTANSMDATSDRDFAIEFAQAASIIGLHLSRFAEEITLHSTAEFGFLDLPEAFSTGSSAMPQKKNPDFTELLRGKSGRLLGAVTTLTAIVKGLPLAYNKDLQETQEAVFEVADTLTEMLPLLAPFTAALRFRYDRMRQAAETGYLNAMAAATYLTGKGVPFRTAHEKIGNAVRFALDSERELNDLSLDELKQFGEEFEADFHDAITLEATLDCHDVTGGTARQQVQHALRMAQRRLDAIRIATQGERKTEAEDALV